MCSSSPRGRRAAAARNLTRQPRGGRLAATARRREHRGQPGPTRRCDRAQVFMSAASRPRGKSGICAGTASGRPAPPAEPAARIGRRAESTAEPETVLNLKNSYHRPASTAPCSAARAACSPAAPGGIGGGGGGARARRYCTVQGSPPPQACGARRAQHWLASAQQSPATAHAGQSQQQPESAHASAPAHGTAAQLPGPGAEQAGNAGSVPTTLATVKPTGRGAARRCDIANASARMPTAAVVCSAASREPAAQHTLLSAQQSPEEAQAESQQHCGSRMDTASARCQRGAQHHALRASQHATF
jgi:hypothetical protein